MPWPAAKCWPLLGQLCRQCAGVSQRPAGPFGVAAAKREASRALSRRLTPATTGYLRRRFTPASSPGRTASRRTGRGIERCGRGPCGRSADSRWHCRPTWRRLSVRCFRYSLSDFSYERRREPCRGQVFLHLWHASAAWGRPGSTQSGPSGPARTVESLYILRVGLGAARGWDRP